MDRSNHYEAAFEAYLRQRRLCYIAVDESRRSLLDKGPVKSLDFIVYGDATARLLIDVKGRKFPGGTEAKPRRVWQCWAERDDVDGLERWSARFGLGYTGLLVFAYDIQSFVRLHLDTPDLWEWRGHRYLFRAVAIDVYRSHMKTRSPKWGTVDLPTPVFRDHVRPFRTFTDPHRAA